MRKIIVAGSRNFNNYEFLKESLDILIGDSEAEIVSGTAKGADSLGERYALEKGLSLKQFRAEWSRYKGAAGYIRNEEMAEYATEVAVFWDGKSNGTKHMVRHAKTIGLKTRMFIGY